MKVEVIIARLAIMERIIDGCFGMGTVDDIIEGTLEDKSYDEIMDGIIKKKRMKENKESCQSRQVGRNKW